MALFNNLSPYGAVSVRVEDERKKLKEENDEASDEKMANRFFSSIAATGKEM